jgi:hypothetical protein
MVHSFRIWRADDIYYIAGACIAMYNMFVYVREENDDEKSESYYEQAITMNPE